MTNVFRARTVCFAAAALMAITGYSIASDVSTTLQRTVVPGPKPSAAIRLDEISKYKEYGYGSWTFGAPLKSVTRTDIMPALYDGTAVTKKAKLLNFLP